MIEQLSPYAMATITNMVVASFAKLVENAIVSSDAANSEFTFTGDDIRMDIDEFIELVTPLVVAIADEELAKYLSEGLAQA